MEKNCYTLTALIAVILLIIAGIMTFDMRTRIEEKHQQKIAQAYQEIYRQKQQEQRIILDKEIASLELDRMMIFLDYKKELESPEVMSVFHQLYCAINAQIRLTNILVEENQLLLRIQKDRK